jgi:hypothetical protein
MGNIVGSNPETWALDQIKLRQQLLGAPSRDSKVLAYINNKTSWIRAASSVAIQEGIIVEAQNSAGQLVRREINKSSELTGTPNYAGRELAKQYVLFNGTVGLREGQNDQLIAQQKFGLTNNSSIINDFAYGFGGITQGIVPMPGIESLSINTYNRGALRKAELKIKAYNRQQFAIIDALYMRPGYTLLIEWGHTIYYTGTLENPVYQQAEFNTPAFKNLFRATQNDKTITQDTLLKNVRDQRTKTEGNYDGFYGKVTNFSWTYNTDGSYSITVSAISLGDVIESLNINRIASTNITTDTSKNTLEKTNSLIANKDKSQFNKNLYEIYNYLVNNIGSQGTSKPIFQNSPTQIRSFNTSYFNAIANDIQRTSAANQSIVFDNYELVAINSKANINQGDKTSSSTNYPFMYVKLKTLLEIIQNGLLIYDDNLTPLISFDLEANNYCYTFPYQYSLDPNICAIPFSTAPQNGDQFNFKEVNNVYWDQILGDSFSTTSKFVGNLFNIHVNINYVSDLIVQYTDSNNELPLLKLLEGLMNGIQKALGGVNKFTVSYDHDTNKIKIYDDIPLDPKITKTTDRQPAQFNVLGFTRGNLEGTFVTNVSLTTKISNQLATMISVGAQSRNPSDIVNATGFQRWNEGLIDIITPEKVSEVVAEKPEEAKSDPNKVMAESYNKLLSSDGVITKYYTLGQSPTKDIVDSQLSTAASVFSFVVSNYAVAEDKPTQTFIPFDLGLEFDGFSGLKIYEKFTVSPEILPLSYPRLNFVVKGLKHDISTSGWKTTIESLAFEAVR